MSPEQVKKLEGSESAEENEQYKSCLSQLEACTRGTFCIYLKRSADFIMFRCKIKEMDKIQLKIL